MEELIQEAEETGEQISMENTTKALTVGGTCVPTDAAANEPGASLVCSGLGPAGKEMCNDSIGNISNINITEDYNNTLVNNTGNKMWRF